MAKHARAVHSKSNMDQQLTTWRALDHGMAKHTTTQKIWKMDYDTNATEYKMTWLEMNQYNPQTEWGQQDTTTHVGWLEDDVHRTKFSSSTAQTETDVWHGYRPPEMTMIDETA